MPAELQAFGAILMEQHAIARALTEGGGLPQPARTPPGSGVAGGADGSVEGSRSTASDFAKVTKALISAIPELSGVSSELNLLVGSQHMHEGNFGEASDRFKEIDPTLTAAYPSMHGVFSQAHYLA